MTDRIEPPLAAGEKETLTGFLDYQRATLRHKCQGLSPDQLILPACPPSPLRLLGLVRHLTEVEHWWLSQVFAGDEGFDTYAAERDRDADLLVAHVDPELVADTWWRWEEQLRHSRAIVGSVGLDTLASNSVSEGAPSLRWVLVHLIEEYSRHNGHADLLREAIDGAVGE